MDAEQQKILDFIATEEKSWIEICRFMFGEVNAHSIERLDKLLRRLNSQNLISFRPENSFSTVGQCLYSLKQPLESASAVGFNSSAL